MWHDARQVGQAHADRSKLVVIEPAGDFERLEAARFVDTLLQIGHCGAVQPDDLAEHRDRALGVGGAFRNNVDAEIRSV